MIESVSPLSSFELKVCLAQRSFSPESREQNCVSPLRLLCSRSRPCSVASTVVVHLARDANLVEPADQPVGTVRLSFRLFRRRLRLGVLLPGERVQQLGFELEAVDAKLARRLESR